MSTIVSVDPFRCRMWRWHERNPEQITAESCRTEIESFAEHGQLVPVLGRPLVDDERYDVELIYGARRLFVARALHKPLMIELRELSDQEAIIAMDIENRLRKDISPYERGLSYLRWMRSGYFRSQEDIAAALKISSSQVSRLLKLARLPSVVINAFGSGAEIREVWGQELSDALLEPGRRQRILRTARAIAESSPRPGATEVYQRLLNSDYRARRSRTASHDIVVRGKNGGWLFRIRRQRDSVAIIFPPENISACSLANIEDVVARILRASPAREAGQTAEPLRSPGLTHRGGGERAVVHGGHPHPNLRDATL
jgi:ParB family transcriptional regulator, chromosome partitioning protein